MKSWHDVSLTEAENSNHNWITLLQYTNIQFLLGESLFSSACLAPATSTSPCNLYHTANLNSAG